MQAPGAPVEGGEGQAGEVLVAPETPAPAAPPAPAQPVLSPTQAAVAAFGAIAIVNAITIAGYVSLPARGGLWLRALHHFYDAGHLLAMGLVAASAVLSWERWGPRRPALGYALLGAASVAAGFVVLDEDLFGFAQRNGAVIPPGVLLPLSTVIVALGVPLALLAGRLLARVRMRVVGLAAAIAAAVLNHFLLRNDYPGAHLYMTAGSAALFAGSAAGAPLGFSRAPAFVAGALRAARRAAISRAFLIGLALWAAVAVVVPPKNATLVELLKASGSSLAPFIARVVARTSAGRAAIPDAMRPWFSDRSGVPPIAPSTPALLPPSGVVLILSVDALRADVLQDKAHARALPTLSALRRESVYFTEARSPGSQTVYSITTLFAGTYFAQQYWTPLRDGSDRYLWPHEDTSVRFPELLKAAGIPTVTFAAATWMRNAWGVVRGFSEERYIESGTKYAAAVDVASAAIERINAHGGGPLFLFMHFLDPHSPYDRAGTSGSPFNRYLGEVGLVDKEIGRIRQALVTAGLWDRTALIVTADHGEAFGEHDSTSHATTLYEEQLRVPLLIRAPGVAPRSVGQPVSLVDLGPTVLDLMGAATPGHFMGESLVPFLRGENPALTRPIAAEGRLKRTIIFPDGYKAIVDERLGTVEVFNLEDDPSESRNLFDEGGEAARRADIVRAFFKAHTIKKSGYRVPYRR